MSAYTVSLQADRLLIDTVNASTPEAAARQFCKAHKYTFGQLAKSGKAFLANGVWYTFKAPKGTETVPVAKPEAVATKPAAKPAKRTRKPSTVAKVAATVDAKAQALADMASVPSNPRETAEHARVAIETASPANTQDAALAIIARVALAYMSVPAKQFALAPHK